MADTPEEQGAEAVRRTRLLELTEGIPDGELERVINTGRAMAKLGNIAERIRAAAGGAGRELEREEDELEPDLEAIRGGIAKDLTYAVLDSGAYVDLDVMDRARTIRDLAEAYVRLGGELAIVPAPAPVRFNPADVTLREKVRGAVWQAVNDSGAGTDVADTAAARIELVLEELAR